MTSFSQEKITAIDQYTGSEIVILFRDNLQSYCWGQHVPGKFVFYFYPEDNLLISEALSNGGCISFHYKQFTTYMLSSAHWYYS
jgi:hypothetical protein